MSNTASRQTDDLRLLPDECVLWTGHSALGDVATSKTTLNVFAVAVLIGILVFARQSSPLLPRGGSAYALIVGLAFGVCAIFLVLVRPFRRSGYVVTTQRAIFLNRQNVVGRFVHSAESAVLLRFPIPIRLRRHRHERGTITFEGSGRKGLDLAFSRITDAQRVFALLCVVQRYWATDEPQRAELPTSQCLGCGYSLVGNVSGRCPECGQPTYPVSSDIDGIVTIPITGQTRREDTAVGKGEPS